MSTITVTKVEPPEATYTITMPKTAAEALAGLFNYSAVADGMDNASPGTAREIREALVAAGLSQYTYFDTIKDSIQHWIRTWGS